MLPPVEPLLAYLSQYPAVAALLGALAIMFVWTVIKGLLKLAVMSAIVLAISFFVTHQKASEAWVDSAGDVAKDAAAAIVKQGSRAIDGLSSDAGIGDVPGLSR